MPVQPWEAYQIYTALKLHFESASYDALKFCYRTSASQSSFLKRRDRFFFAKIARKYPDRQTLIDFLVANFAKRGEACWIGDLLDSESEERYAEWLKIRDSFGYHFTEQNHVLLEHCRTEGIKMDDLFRASKSQQYPPVVQLYQHGKISLETLTVFDEIIGFMKDQSITETIFWPQFSMTVAKYRPFVRQNVDVKKCKQIALSTFTSVEC